VRGAYAPLVGINSDGIARTDDATYLDVLAKKEALLDGDARKPDLSLRVRTCCTDYVLTGLNLDDLIATEADAESSAQACLPGDTHGQKFLFAAAAQVAPLLPDDLHC